MPGSGLPGTCKSLNGRDASIAGVQVRVTAPPTRDRRPLRILARWVSAAGRVAEREAGPEGGPTITMKKIRILAALAAMALLVSACGDSTKESAADKFAETAAQQAKTQASTPAETTTTAPTATKVAPSAGERDISTKPKIPKASGPAPK